MEKPLSKIAHASWALGITAGAAQADMESVAMRVIGPVAAIGVGAAWEFGLQPLAKKAFFPKWEKPAGKDVVAWIVGAGFGVILNLAIGGQIHRLIQGVL